jgi:acetylornithine deacetylase/succinyl-diaminopimelate desuccinylase-like protein
MERAVGVAPVLMRSGGSIPAVAELAHRGIPAIVSGFALAEDRIHSPDESFRLESLQMGERAARELYLALAALP